MKWEGQSVDNVVWEGQSVDNVIFNSNVVKGDPAGLPFISTWRTTTDNEVLQFPANNYIASGWNATIDWGDGTANSTITDRDDPDLAHTYSTAGDYVIKVYGPAYLGISSLSTSDMSKLIKVHQLGNPGYQDFVWAFNDTDNLEHFDPGVCDTSMVQNFKYFLDSPGLTTVDLSTMSWASAEDLSACFWITDLTEITLPKNPEGSPSVTNMTDFMRYSYDVEEVDWGTLTTQNVTSMDKAFERTSYYVSNPSYWAPIADFNIGSLTSAVGMFVLVSIPTSVYDDLLVKWEAQSHQPNVTADFGSSKYTADSAAATARAALIADGWTISDGGTA
jgi:hypothetical protein